MDKIDPRPEGTPDRVTHRAARRFGKPTIHCDLALLYFEDPLQHHEAKPLPARS
ncbi:MAG: hypothetical protein ACFCU4_02155 [Puniceicoccaceae bacterium]